MITNWNHKFQWIEPLVVIIEEACENWSVLVCNKIEKFGIISVADVKNFIVKPSLDVESITEDVSSLRLEKNKVLCFSVADNVVVTFSMLGLGWTIVVRSYVGVVDSIKRSCSISRIHYHSLYVFFRLIISSYNHYDWIQPTY